MGSLNELPNYYGNWHWYETGDNLADWIAHETPCFAGYVPIQYAEALLTLFEKKLVPDRIIAEAFFKLDKKGIRFDWGGEPPPLTNRNGLPRPPVMGQGPLNKRERDRFDQLTMEDYERRYVLAIRTNDVADAELILGAVFALLWNLVKGYGLTRQAEHNEKMLEWEEFNTAVNEALERATTLKTHIRYLSREQVRELRAATPMQFPSVAVRFARQLTLRAIPPARRSRK